MIGMGDWLRPRARVDFLIGGAQRCGTTFLYHELAERPGFALPERKEQRFFLRDRYFARRPIRRLAIRRYDRRFPRGRGLTGDATPEYLWWPGAIARIRKVAPHVRWVVLLRNPVTRAYSQWRMLHDEYFPPLPREPRGFAEVMGEELERARAEPDRLDPERFAPPGYLTRGLYDVQLRRLFAAFDPSRVAIVSTAALRAAPHDRVAELEDFLHGRAGPVRHLEVGPARALDPDLPRETWDALADFFAPTLEATGRLLGADLARWATNPMSD